MPVLDTASDAPEDTPVASEEIPAGEVDSAEGRKPKRRRLKRRHPDDELDSVASVSFRKLLCTVPLIVVPALLRCM